MQVITPILVLLSLAEAGLIAKAPRTEIPAPATGMFMITSSSATATPAIPPTVPTSATQASATPEGLIPGTPIANSGNPEPTPAPFVGLESGIVGPQSVTDDIKFVQTTYWACETNAIATHCGWHMPILDTSAATLSVGRESTAIRAGLVAAGVAVALIYGL
ncbi:hypothetical protein GGS24DRAFT_241129 [Hypoxylon argillaceum]|nr:hypothetical protein GGS24DRAFT_241129 [Hypoxylon argillaceum]